MQWMSMLAFLLASIHCAAAATQPSETIPYFQTGFTPGTQVDLSLDMTSLHRSVDLIRIGGDIIITNGSGNNTRNEVYIFGQRKTPLLQGETAWAFNPNPMTVILAKNQGSSSVVLPFGPKYIPSGSETSTQYYLYKAEIKYDGGGGASVSETLTVYNSLFPDSIIIPIDEEFVTPPISEAPISSSNEDDPAGSTNDVAIP